MNNMKMKYYFIISSSADKSKEIVEKWINSQKKIDSMIMYCNNRKSEALKKGAEFALKSSDVDDFFIFFDSNGVIKARNLKKISTFIQDTADIYIGNRNLAYYTTTNETRWTLKRYQFINYLSKFFFNLPHIDVECGFKILSRRAVTIWLKHKRYCGLFFDGELISIMIDNSLKIISIDIDCEFKKRRYDFINTNFETLNFLAYSVYAFVEIFRSKISHSFFYSL
jgi:hypothetical protein